MGVTIHEKLDELLSYKLSIDNGFLLWERNGGSFNSQTISLDLSEYRYITIECYAEGASNPSKPHLFKVGDTGTICATTSSNGMYRSVTTSATGVTFGQGYWSSNGSGSYANPFRIYGYK